MFDDRRRITPKILIEDLSEAAGNQEEDVQVDNRESEDKVIPPETLVEPSLLRVPRNHSEIDVIGNLQENRVTQRKQKYYRERI